MNSDVSTLADWIAESPSTVFFGGAGVSTESGIPEFRGANGFYFQEREIPLETVLSIDFFTRHPEAYWEWFREIYHPVDPNGRTQGLGIPGSRRSAGCRHHAEHRRPAPAGRVARCVGAARQLGTARVHALRGRRGAQ